MAVCLRIPAIPNVSVHSTSPTNEWGREAWDALGDVWNGMRVRK